MTTQRMLKAVAESPMAAAVLAGAEMVVAAAAGAEPAEAVRPYRRPT